MAFYVEGASDAFPTLNPTFSPINSNLLKKNKELQDSVNALKQENSDLKFLIKQIKRQCNEEVRKDESIYQQTLENDENQIRMEAVEKAKQIQQLFQSQMKLKDEKINSLKQLMQNIETKYKRDLENMEQKILNLTNNNSFLKESIGKQKKNNIKVLKKYKAMVKQLDKLKKENKQIKNETDIPSGDGIDPEL
tara:strand:- start:257 stop:835 length:579 start_codon:yes stop_codon:yes gene_type:complete